MKSKPVFNKRLYRAKAGIHIAKEAKEILTAKPSVERTHCDLHALQCVVSGLKDIHKNFEFAKKALGFAISYEKYDMDREIVNDGKELSYYILNGAVEAFYKVERKGLIKDDTTVSYTHVSGDYIGLVSSDGARFDLPSPESFTTIEMCEFIKIDRNVFHEKIEEGQKEFRHEIRNFLERHSLFDKISRTDRNKLISQMAKQEFPAGKQILPQGKKQEHAFFIAKGRCGYYRRIFLPEQQRSELFKMGFVEEGSYFDPSCILDDQESKFSVIAVGPVTCYLLNKWTIKNSESLLKALITTRPEFPSDKSIDQSIEVSDQWQSYKRDIVCNTLVKKEQHSRIIPENSVSKTLHHAIRCGTALRRQRQQHLSHHPQDSLDRIASKPQTPLQEAEPEHGKAVLKAVMLMKRSCGSIPKEKEQNKETSANNAKIERNKQPSRNTVKTQTESNSKNTTLTKQQYEMSMVKKQITNFKNKQGVKDIKNETKSQTTAKTEFNYNFGRPRSNTELNSSEKALVNRKIFEKPLPERANTAPVTRKTSRLFIGARNKTVDKKSMEAPLFSKTNVAEEHWITNNEQTFLVKEVINTHIPGKLYQAPTTYNRFGPSMFECLDKIKSIERDLKTDPFKAKLAATSWLKKIRGSSQTLDYNPGPSPVIVIAEYCDKGGEENTVSEDNNGGTFTNCNENKIAHNQGICGGISMKQRHLSKTKGLSGSLGTLMEDSDKETLQEKADKNEWRTAVHETKYEAEHCLEKTKQEIAEIQKELFRLGWSKEKLQEIENKLKHERRHSGKISDQCKKVERPIKKLPKIKSQSERKMSLKRQNSLQKILAEQSSRRCRHHNSGGNAQARKTALTKSHSAGALYSQRASCKRQYRAKTSVLV